MRYILLVLVAGCAWYTNKLTGKEDQDIEASCRQSVGAMVATVDTRTPAQVPTARWDCQYQNPKGEAVVDSITLTVAGAQSTASGVDSFGQRIAANGPAGADRVSYSSSSESAVVLRADGASLVGEGRWFVPGPADQPAEKATCFATKVVCVAR
ncbi:MAG: hypothetical protein ABI678_07845 [Kofleriaceae bacterium]